MSLFETLKNKYPIQQIAMYGDCIIIPIVEFGDDWEKRLKEEGYMSHIVQINYVGRWAVQLRKAEVYKKEPFPDPPKEKSSKKEILAINRNKADWTKEEKDRLMKRWSEVTPPTALGKARELQKEFPERSEHAIYLMQYGLTGGKATHQRKPSAAATTKSQLEQQKKQVEEEHKLYLENGPEEKPEPPNAGNVSTRTAEPKSQIIDVAKRVREIAQEIIADKSNDNAKRIIALEVELKTVIATINGKIDDLETTLGKYIQKFEDHEHSEHTGKPLVPP
jgi:hypothetical protein